MGAGMFTWNNDIAPAYAKVIKGELVRISTVIPEFDLLPESGERIELAKVDVDNGKEVRTPLLSPAEMAAVGWYRAIADAPAMNDDLPQMPRVQYSLVSFDANGGTAVLAMERFDSAPPPAAMRKLLYERESDELVIRAMRLQLLNDTSEDGRQKFEEAKAAALAKVAEIKARHPDV